MGNSGTSGSARLHCPQNHAMDSYKVVLIPHRKSTRTWRMASLAGEKPTWALWASGGEAQQAGATRYWLWAWHLLHHMQKQATGTLWTTLDATTVAASGADLASTRQMLLPSRMKPSKDLEVLWCSIISVQPDHPFNSNTVSKTAGMQTSITISYPPVEVWRTLLPEYCPFGMKK